MQQQYVAIDLHRWRSVIVREDQEGHEPGVARIDNSALALSQAVGEAGPWPADLDAAGRRGGRDSYVL